MPLDGRRRRTISATRLGGSGNARAARRGWSRRSTPIATRCGKHARARAARLGDDAEQSRQRAWALGERESGTAQLEEAVTAYRDALKENTASARRSNGRRRRTISATRFGGSGNARAARSSSKQAVTAYRDALQEKTRERVPLEWAITQKNLGGALRTLGERESGTGRLEEAVDAFHEALKEWTRERVPLEWARTQNNLGTALATLGERESGTGGWSRRSTPIARPWRNNARARAARLGDDAEEPRQRALDARGTRERHGRLEQAVTAYRDALQEWTARARAARLGGDAEHSRHRACDARGTRERDGAAAARRSTPFATALQESTRERAPLDWAMTQNNAPSAPRQATPGCIRPEYSSTLWRQAGDAFRDSLPERHQSRAPHRHIRPDFRNPKLRR